MKCKKILELDMSKDYAGPKVSMAEMFDPDSENGNKAFLRAIKFSIEEQERLLKEAKEQQQMYDLEKWKAKLSEKDKELIRKFVARSK